MTQFRIAWLALNTYLGNYLGEFLGELAFNGFFLLSAITILSARSGFPKWVGYAGGFAAVIGLSTGNPGSRAEPHRQALRRIIRCKTPHSHRAAAFPLD